MGLQKCYIDGKLRYLNGKTVEGKWLIIGREGATGMAILDGEKILHIPKDGELLKARLKPTEANWNTIEVKGIHETKTTVFVLSEKDHDWHIDKPSAYVSGKIIGDEISLAPVDFKNL